jgi:hypothetical protein
VDYISLIFVVEGGDYTGIRPTLISDGVKDCFGRQRETNQGFDDEVAGNLLNKFDRQRCN